MENETKTDVVRLLCESVENGQKRIHDLEITEIKLLEQIQRMNQKIEALIQLTTELTLKKAKQET